MSYVLMTKPGCKVCTRARVLLKANRLAYTVSEHDTPEKIQRFKDAGYTSFPQIFDAGILVGGYDALEEYLDT